MAEQHRHPWFAAIYDRMMAAAGDELVELRKVTFSRAHGIVVEVGAGTGLNFAYYRSGQVERVHAFEPDPYMRKHAEDRAKEATVAVDVLDATAEVIPRPSASADTVVASLVFCSFDDPDAAAAEIRRILKPDGILLFVEHIRSDEWWRSVLQDAVTPIWRRIGANCHPNRATLDVLTRAGFVVAKERAIALGFPWTKPIVAGAASRAA
jgi:ubiquinone/menaquinone biosynthesis C-methylase UbiE